MAPRTPLAVVILAAGQGTRMKSALAKVLHDLGGRPLLGWPLAAAEALRPEALVVVVGRDAEKVAASFDGRARFVVQAEQNGTGHAVQCALPALKGFKGDVLVVCGDTPLLTTAVLLDLVRDHARALRALTVLSAEVREPGSLGRILRGPDGRLKDIRETADATPAERAVKEINTGVVVAFFGIIAIAWAMHLFLYFAQELTWGPAIRGTRLINAPDWRWLHVGEMAVFFLVQQGIENNFLVPKVMGQQVGLSAVTVIVALCIGSSLLGLVGALLAVPTAAIVQVLVEELLLHDDAA